MMKKKLALFILVLVFGAASIFAQATRREAAGRERIRENIHRLRLLRMTEVLELTEEQTARIYPAANRIEKEKAEIMREIGVEIQALRDLLGEERPAEQEIAEKVKSINGLRQAVQEKDRDFEAVLEENLTEIQKAKYLIFAVEFYRDLGEKLGRARREISTLPKARRKY